MKVHIINHRCGDDEIEVKMAYEFLIGLGMSLLSI